jgi:6,7-dimethyl-8-ribityllumazine synthase
MSGTGYPAKINVDGTGFRCAIVAASWHDEIVSRLIWGAQEYLSSANFSHEIFRVAGSFELPFACQQALSDDFDLAIALGLVVRGETPHFDFVAAGTTNGIMEVMLKFGKPIGFGLLTCESLEQANDRASISNLNFNKGAEAAYAAASLLETVKTEH